jgi:phosphoserine phosphatase RsbU/P
MAGVPRGEAEIERRLAAIADPELDRLPTDQLADAVLGRIRDVLDADTSALLVVDPSRTHLTAAAAHGLEDEVLQGFRLAIGAGFAGSVAARRQPAILDEIMPGTVANPLIIARGLHSMAAVPLISGGDLVGVLHVGSTAPAHFDATDLVVMEAIGERLATALHAERAAAERSAARTLQRSLLPGRLPSIDGLEMASRFVPAANFGVGGDWFDAFALPDGRVGIVMGDVTGSGLAAAVVMGRLRSALRAYALDAGDPGEVLAKLNRKFMHFEPGQMATVLYLTISPDHETIALATAGHPPPVLATPGGDPSFIECTPHPPIGVIIGDPPVVTECRLEVGTAVACFTDGLFERRTEPIDAQLDRLCRSVKAVDVEMVCNGVMSTMVGDHHVEDDTALLVVRRVA